MRRIFSLFWALALIAAILSACRAAGTQNQNTQSQSGSGESTGGIVVAALTEKTGIADLDCTADFSACAYVKNTDGGGQLVVLKDGGEDTVFKTGEGFALREPLFSPDGKYIAFKVVNLGQTKQLNPYGEVYIYERSGSQTFQTGVPVCVGGMGKGEEFYSWSADSSKLLMEFCVVPSSMTKHPQSFVYWDGASQTVVEVSVPQSIMAGVCTSGEQCFRAAFSPDGTKIAYSVYDANGIALRLFDCGTKTRSDIAMLDTKRDYTGGLYVLPIVWISGSEFLSGGLPEEDDGSDTLFRVNIPSGTISKIDVNESLFSISPSGKYLITLGDDGYALRDMDTGTSISIPDAPGKFCVWSRDSQKIIFWAGNRLGVVGVDGKTIGTPVTERIGDSTPTFVSDGVWYEKRV